MNKKSNVKKVIGVVSGKGGVGKSSITSMLAVTAQRMGHKTAILDGDITGPSIPKAFGIEQKAMGSETEIFPVVSDTGIEIISINSLLEDDTDPVAWRGPVLSGVIEQLERRGMGRYRRDVRGYASRNRRCRADRIPVTSSGRTGDSYFSAGTGFHDSGKSSKDGRPDECPYYRHSRKHVLFQMSGLRKRT